MAPFVLFLAVAVMAPQQPPQIKDAPRLRTILKSGAVTLVERLPDAPYCSVQLWVTGRECAETVATHGRRHLLEHIVTKGRMKDLDRRLEARGMVLTAQTYRDAMNFEITCSPKDLPFATRAIAEILEPVQTTQEEIVKESKVIEQEMALRGTEQNLSSVAWTQVFGEAGLDPVGAPAVIKETTPEDLAAIQAKQFDRRGMALVIAGPVALAEASVLARDALGEEPTSKKPAEIGRPEGTPGKIETELPGEARAAMVPSIEKERTVWTLAAGMALANHYRLGILYTPSEFNGLVVLTSLESGAMSHFIDEIDESEIAQLSGLGADLMRAWLNTDSPSALASIRGSLLAHRVDLRPEKLVEMVDRMTDENFLEGFRAFKLDRAMAVTGNAPPLSIPNLQTTILVNAPPDRVRTQSDPPLVLHVEEDSHPSSDLVVADAFIAAPGLNGKERAALTVLGDVLLQGTQEYTPNQLMEFGGQAGLAPQVHVLPDMVWIQVVLPKDGLDVAVSVLESIIRRPSLRTEDIQAAISRRRNIGASIWQQALDPSVLDFGRVKSADVREVHLRLFRPESTRFSLYGAFGPGAGEKAIKDVFGNWNPRRAPKSVPDPMAKPLWLRKPLVATFELRSNPMKLGDPRLPAQVLAAYALGVGGASTLTQQMRERNGWTYRQEAVIWPTLDGLQFRFLAAQASADGQQNMPETMRKLMTEDIATWTEATLSRALGLLEASIARPLEINPFTTGPGAILGSGPTANAYWMGLNQLTGGTSGTLASFVEAAKGVSLEQLKAAASDLLSEAKPVIVYGGKLPEIPEQKDGGADLSSPR